MIKEAVKFIKSGRIVAFPTETVYGLGADATNDEACKKIFKAKGRPSINPLIIHIKNIEQAQSLGEFNEYARILSEKFWPGPLTLVLNLKKGSNIAASVLAGLSTIALRIPSHPLALELINQSETFIAAPSANPSGYISSTETSHVMEHFRQDDVYILEDSNKSTYGLESTIIDLSSSEPTLLRHGFITVELLESVLNQKIKISNSLMEIKAPGMLAKHYSPHTELRINAENLQANEIGLNFGDSKLCSNYSLNLSETGDLIEAAANLYSMLRKLDDYATLNKISKIAVAPIPFANIGFAINDKLNRASYIYNYSN